MLLLMFCYFAATKPAQKSTSIKKCLFMSDTVLIFAKTPTVTLATETKKKTTNDAPDQIIQIKNVINPERTGLPPFLKTV
jgi:hypothetical protein